MQKTATMLCVTDLEWMARPVLINTWKSLIKTPVPKELSKSFLRRLIAIELQSQQFGGLPKRTQSALTVETTDKMRPSSAALKPGGRILREWNGVTHIIDVTDSGFDWKDNTYRSLSAIAREITGAHWSGPRFFGLNKKASA